MSSGLLSAPSITLHHVCYGLPKNRSLYWDGTASNWLDDLRGLRTVSALWGNLTLRHSEFSELLLKEVPLNLNTQGMPTDSLQVHIFKFKNNFKISYYRSKHMCTIAWIQNTDKPKEGKKILSFHPMTYYWYLSNFLFSENHTACLYKTLYSAYLLQSNL